MSGCPKCGERCDEFYCGCKPGVCIGTLRSIPHRNARSGGDEKPGNGA